MTIARDLLGVPLVNIGGTDIVDGQHKLVLAILWQLMRAHMRRLLQASPSGPGHDMANPTSSLQARFSNLLTGCEGHRSRPLFLAHSLSFMLGQGLRVAYSGKRSAGPMYGCLPAPHRACPGQSL